MSTRIFSCSLLFPNGFGTMCMFHFLGIGEVMLTPYDFSVIIGLRLVVKESRLMISLL